MNIKQQLDMQARYTAQAAGAKTSEPETVEVTRDSIAKMKRGDVVELLEAHGLSEDDCEGVNVPELRDMLISAMFVNL